MNANTNYVTNEFFFENQQVRTVVRDGEPWLVLKDVCEIFGETNYRRVSGRLEDYEKGVSQIDTLGGKQTMTIINEAGLYSALFAMQPKKARGVDVEYVEKRQAYLKKFKHWVTHDVLPTIRKHGAYMDMDVIEKSLTDPDFLIQLATTLKEEKQRRMEAEAKIAADEHKVDFYDAVGSTSATLTVERFAKLVTEKLGINTGRNRMFQWLRKNGYLQSNNMPYQRYINNGWFKTYEVVKAGHAFTVPSITGKGQQKLFEKFAAEA